MADLFEWSEVDEAHLKVAADGTINIGAFSCRVDGYGIYDMPKEEVRRLYEALTALFEPDQATRIAKLERQLAGVTSRLNEVTKVWIPPREHNTILAGAKAEGVRMYKLRLQMLAHEMDGANRGRMDAVIMDAEAFANHLEANQ